MNEQAAYSQLARPVLNEEQQAAYDELMRYVFEPGYPYRTMVVTGYAGTGKTTLITQFLEDLYAKAAEKNKVENEKADGDDGYIPNLWSPHVAASAPTHKAVRILRRNAKLGMNVAYATIHSLLGLKPKPDEKTGKQVFVPSGDPNEQRIHEFNVVIVDEVSQLSQLLFDPLDDLSLTGAFKIIFIGDEAQIPPVNELDSAPLLKPELYNMKTLKLTRIMRQAEGNPILELASELRKDYRKGDVDTRLFHKEIDGEGVVGLSSSDTKKIDEILEDYFCSEKFRYQDADYMKVIAWTNTVVDGFNKRIRNMLFIRPEGLLSLPLVMSGEKLILDEPYKLTEQNNRMLPNNEEVEVIDASVVNRAFRYKNETVAGPVMRNANVRCYQTLVKYKDVKDQDRTATLWIVHEAGQKEWADILQSIRKSALDAPFGSDIRRNYWAHFFDIEGMFAKVKYNYAITAHKSQGSTYQYAMVIEWNINQNEGFNRKLGMDRTEERNRIKYVAMSRVKKKLWIVN